MNLSLTLTLTAIYELEAPVTNVGVDTIQQVWSQFNILMSQLGDQATGTIS